MCLCVCSVRCHFLLHIQTLMGLHTLVEPLVLTCFSWQCVLASVCVRETENGQSEREFVLWLIWSLRLSILTLAWEPAVSFCMCRLHLWALYNFDDESACFHAKVGTQRLFEFATNRRHSGLSCCSGDRGGSPVFPVTATVNLLQLPYFYEASVSL